MAKVKFDSGYKTVDSMNDCEVMAVLLQCGNDPKIIRLSKYYTYDRDVVREYLKEKDKDIVIRGI